MLSIAFVSNSLTSTHIILAAHCITKIIPHLHSTSFHPFLSTSTEPASISAAGITSLRVEIGIPSTQEGFMLQRSSVHCTTTTTIITRTLQTPHAAVATALTRHDASAPMFATMIHPLRLYHRGLCAQFPTIFSMCRHGTAITSHHSEHFLELAHESFATSSVHCDHFLDSDSDSLPYPMPLSLSSSGYAPTCSFTFDFGPLGFDGYAANGGEC
ncbi:hypothetical protein K438DRAFT_1971744 [Mycena galopus ATCC 62051]|nr:hypothetical protein K438DRAFT_1971744 [Mycena galopus ATCC 62051]